MLVVVGLGNPGAAYKHTMHNAGFMLLDGIAGGAYPIGAEFARSGKRGLRRLFASRDGFGKTAGPYVAIEGTLAYKQFLMVKPATFMNESGKALAYLVRKAIVRELSELLVVVDDVNLDLGRIRLREKGSAGGQKGLASIIERLGSDDFPRLRLGIGPRPEGSDLRDHVLSGMRPEEREILDRSLLDASKVVGAWIEHGFDGAQREISQLSQ